jgi:ribosomal protein S12 methylthiotransferase
MKNASPSKVCIVSLGCPKNLVDSEVIAGHLVDARLRLVVDPEEADGVIINTCGFIESARQESLETLQEICNLKSAGLVSALVVVGCMVQRYKRELQKGHGEVDAFLPITDYSTLPDLLKALWQKKRPGPLLKAGGRPRSSRTDLSRILLTRPHVSYLRIAEGCNHQCAFCAIPGIRGRLRSKPVEVLKEEAEGLAAVGVKEVNLVAEDTTDYGRDLKGEALLPELLRALGRVRGLRWIRILYAYPSRVTEELILAMAEEPKVLPYIDMPIQHINQGLLKRMRRGTSRRQIERVIHDLRMNIPGVVLRSSVVVGFPGETRDDFLELRAFLDQVRFERLGAFRFSPESGTAAARLPDPVPADLAEERLGEIMTLQKSIIMDRNKSLVGAVEEVIVDAVGEDGEALGRTRADAPDIDCAVWLIPRKRLKSGRILKAKITGSSGYDLLASPVA